MKGLIYRITNLKNGRVYIGSSLKKDRIVGHMNSRKLTSSVHLRKAIKIFGKENFYPEILAEYEIENRSELYEKEQIYLDFYFAKEYIQSGYNKDSLFRKLTYNKNPIAEGGSIWKHNLTHRVKKGKQQRKRTEEEKVAHSLAMKQYYANLRENKKPDIRTPGNVYKIDLNKNISVFKTIGLAAKDAGFLSTTSIKKCLKDMSNLSGTYYCKEENINSILEKIGNNE